MYKRWIESIWGYKNIVSHENLLEYLNFSKRFGIHTATRYDQLGLVMIQDKEPINLYSRKLKGPQIWYTVTKDYLLCIVENQK